RMDIIITSKLVSGGGKRGGGIIRPNGDQCLFLQLMHYFSQVHKHHYVFSIHLHLRNYNSQLYSNKCLHDVNMTFNKKKRHGVQQMREAQFAENKIKILSPVGTRIMHYKSGASVSNPTIPINFHLPHAAPDLFNLPN
ncbi:hypothetical protein ACJX0J_025562, partial [Zea mays]